MGAVECCSRQDSTKTSPLQWEAADQNTDDGKGEEEEILSGVPDQRWRANTGITSSGSFVTTQSSLMSDVPTSPGPRCPSELEWPKPQDEEPQEPQAERRTSFLDSLLGRTTTAMRKTETGASGASRQGMRPSLALLAGSGTKGPEADHEALMWLNWVLEQVWPYANEAVVSHIRTQVEPKLKEALPLPLKGMKFSKIELGSNPPVLGPVVVRHKNSQRAPGIELDVGVEWVCDADISLDLQSVASVGVRRLGVSGSVSVALRPLLKTLPIVAGLQVYMKDPPTLSWDFTGAASLAKFPIIATALRNVVMEIIANKVVVPNELCFHWVAGREHELDLIALRYPMPEGVLRLGVVQAKNLQGRDFNPIGKPTSDPYAIVRVGSQEWRTDTRNRTVNPVWGPKGWHEFLIYSFSQHLHLEVWDADRWKRDDFLGRLGEVRLAELAQSPDRWWPLYGNMPAGGGPIPQVGEVRLVAQTFGLSSKAKMLATPPEPLGGATSKALLHVQLRGLCGLPKESADGAIITMIVEGKEYASSKSTYTEAKQDFVYAPDTQALDPSSQRLAEVLVRKHKVPVEEVARIAGIDQASMEQILKQKPTFTARWDYAVSIPLKDPQTAEVCWRLTTPNAGKTFISVVRQRLETTLATVETAIVDNRISTHLGCPTPLPGQAKPKVATESFRVERLIKAKHMSWEGLLDLRAANQGPGQGLLELDAKLNLYSLSSRARRLDLHPAPKRAGNLFAMQVGQSEGAASVGSLGSATTATTADLPNGKSARGSRSPRCRRCFCCGGGSARRDAAG